MLANMIHAIKDCTSVLREGKHDKLLNEVLGINLWNCMQVRCVHGCILQILHTISQR